MTFEEELLSYRFNILAFLMSLCNDYDLAEDLMQETLLLALKNREKFQPGTMMRAWLFTLARNIFLNIHTWERKNVILEADLNQPRDIQIEASQEFTVMLNELSAIISQLNERSRALAMLLIEGSTQDEIMEALNEKRGTVKSMTTRLRRRVIAELEVGREAASKALGLELLKKHTKRPRISKRILRDRRYKKRRAARKLGES